MATVDSEKKYHAQTKQVAKQVEVYIWTMGRYLGNIKKIYIKFEIRSEIQANEIAWRGDEVELE